MTDNWMSLDEFYDVKQFTIPKYQDIRGFNSTLWTWKDINEEDNPIELVHACNLSWSKAGTMRGMHLQLPPMEQAKMLVVLQGCIIDGFLDLRSKSVTFKQGSTVSLKPTDQYYEAIYIPHGYAHGFWAAEDSLVMYMVSDIYAPNLERSIQWRSCGIWERSNPLVRFESDRDKNAPTLEEFTTSYSR
jgi:dTDP-4-dehydrorhamnose 3,5-epimerase